jgi:hypothetical protein
MRIVASHVGLAATTSVSRARTESAQTRFWIGDRRPADPVQVSDQARAIALGKPTATLSASSPSPTAALLVVTPQQNQNPVDGVGKADSRDPKAASAITSDQELLGSPEGAKLLVLRQLLEAMTGKKIRLARAEDSKRSASTEQALDDLAQLPRVETPTPGASNAAARAGWGLEVDIERTEVDTTSMRFEAAGTVVTEDGKAVTFQASFVNQSRSTSVERISLRAGDAQLKDPLVLLYSGTHAELTDRAEAFDLDADGTLERLPEVTNGAYVVQDLNHNGKVDDGKELLGAISGDGFADLRELDQDGNGFIDSGDPRFNQLSLWNPSESDGSKLTSLADAGVGALYAGNVETPFGLVAQSGDLLGRVKTTGIYLTEAGDARPLEQIDVKI